MGRKGLSWSVQRNIHTQNFSPDCNCEKIYKKLCPKSKIVGIFSCRLKDDGMYAMHINRHTLARSLAHKRNTQISYHKILSTSFVKQFELVCICYHFGNKYDSTGAKNSFWKIFFTTLL